MYGTDSRPYIINRFGANSNVLTASTTELSYADDSVLVALSKADLQSILDAFARRLDINDKKTQVSHQPRFNYLP